MSLSCSKCFGDSQGCSDKGQIPDHCHRPCFSLSPALEPAPPVSAPLFPSLPAVLKELLLCGGPPTYLFSAPSTPRPLQGLSDLCASEGVHRKSLHGQCQEPPCGPHDTLPGFPPASPTPPGAPHLCSLDTFSLNYPPVCRTLTVPTSRPPALWTSPLQELKCPLPSDISSMSSSL